MTLDAHWLARAALALGALLASGCASVADKRPPPPTLEEVVQMSQQGVPANEIVAQLVYTRAAYRLKGSELAKLKERGVPDEVLDYLEESNIALARADEARRQAQYRFMYTWPYGGFGPYPYYWYYPPPPPRRY
jgi:hypothetical protein